MKYVVECSETQWNFEEDGHVSIQDVLHNVFIIDDTPEVCKMIGEAHMMSTFALDILDKHIHHVTVTPLGTYCDNLVEIGKKIRKNVEEGS